MGSENGCEPEMKVPSLGKRPWSSDEDAALLAAVEKYGACRWSMIATHLLSGRIGKQCRERWSNHLCPNVRKAEWTSAEDEAILQGVAKIGTRWCEIVKMPGLAGRTDNSIKNRYYSLQRKTKLQNAAANAARARSSDGLGESVLGKRRGELDLLEHKQRSRITRLAKELASAKTESERDRLIHELATALHESSDADARASASTASRRAVSPGLAPSASQIVSNLKLEMEHVPVRGASPESSGPATEPMVRDETLLNNLPALTPESPGGESVGSVATITAPRDEHVQPCKSQLHKPSLDTAKRVREGQPKGAALRIDTATAGARDSTVAERPSGVTIDASEASSTQRALPKQGSKDAGANVPTLTEMPLPPSVAALVESVLRQKSAEIEIKACIGGRHLFRCILAPLSSTNGNAVVAIDAALCAGWGTNSTAHTAKRRCLPQQTAISATSIEISRCSKSGVTTAKGGRTDEPIAVPLVRAPPPPPRAPPPRAPPPRAPPPRAPPRPLRLNSGWLEGTPDEPPMTSPISGEAAFSFVADLFAATPCSPTHKGTAPWAAISAT